MQKSLWQKAVFLDRDGVLNYEPGDYTWLPEKFEVLPGVLNALRTWKEDGFALIVITNQGGIDKGIYTHNDVNAVHQYFQGLCIMNGFVIDDFYYCPHHSVVSGKCLCRKPGSLMLEKALHKYQLDPGNCLMLGDKERDMQAAAAAGVKGILLEINKGFDAGIID